MIKHAILATVAAFALHWGSTPSQAGQVETRHVLLPQSSLAQLFDAALGGTQLTLNNHGSQQGSGQAIHWTNNTSFVAPPGGAPSFFDLPTPTVSIQTAGIGHRIYKIYVNDVNSASVQAQPDGSRIALALAFESEGPEIKIRCIRRKIINGRWEVCQSADVHLDDLVLRPRFAPAIRDGSISFATLGASDVGVEFDLSLSGHWLCAIGNLCNRIAGEVKGRIADEIRSRVRERLNHDSLRDRVADTIREAPAFQFLLGVNGVTGEGWSLTEIAVDGQNYRLRYERATAIQEVSAAASQLPGACPLPAGDGKPVRVAASVATAGAMQVRMRYRLPEQAWSGWHQQVSVPAGGGSHLAVFDVTSAAKLPPGNHMIDIDIDRHDALPQLPVTITCPFTVTDVQLLAFDENSFNPHSGGPAPLPEVLETTCPAQIALRPIFTHSGIGTVRYRYRFLPQHQVTTEYQASFMREMEHPLYEAPETTSVFPLPLPAQQAQLGQTGTIGGFQSGSGSTSGQPQMTAGQSAPNVHKGAVRVEVTGPGGTAASDWIPYHIVCTPQAAIQSPAAIAVPTTPTRPVPPAALVTPPPRPVPPAISGTATTRAATPSTPAARTVPVQPRTRPGPGATPPRDASRAAVPAIRQTPPARVVEPPRRQPGIRLAPDQARPVVVPTRERPSASGRATPGRALPGIVSPGVRAAPPQTERRRP
ncbi:hypothetical protein [Salinarimonas sp.]|uniref:hypothetical protein n=1 Tax=Salinarimonas sp. TaxID=2766526 RepID=UPI00391D2FEE